jgi:hypothetical protein
MNTYNCDTLGEDPHTAEFRQRTLSFLNAPAAEQAEKIPVLARRVDYIHRRYARDWSEVFGVVIYGEPHATISRVEFEVLRQMDGKRTVREIASQLAAMNAGENAGEAIRDLARRGIVDLLTQPMAMGQISRKIHSLAA